MRDLSDFEAQEKEVETVAPVSEGQSTAPAAANGAIDYTSSWYSTHILSVPAKRDLKITYHDGAGVSFKNPVSPVSSKNGRGLRGDVKSCSCASRRRLRQFCLDYVAEGEQWGVTLTLRLCESIDLWRRNWHSFNVWANRSHIPIVWRVELQKRGVPHVHMIVWGSEQTCASIRQKWLRLWHVENDPEHVRHAVDIRPANEGWYGYLILHQQKHCIDQSSGWRGRHWGIICRHFFDGDGRSNSA